MCHDSGWISSRTKHPSLTPKKNVSRLIELVIPGDPRRGGGLAQFSARLFPAGFENQLAVGPAAGDANSTAVGSSHSPLPARSVVDCATTDHTAHAADGLWTSSKDYRPPHKPAPRECYLKCYQQGRKASKRWLHPYCYRKRCQEGEKPKKRRARVTFRLVANGSV